jgi:hypothetical protein
LERDHHPRSGGWTNFGKVERMKALKKVSTAAALTAIYLEEQLTSQQTDAA